MTGRMDEGMDARTRGRRAEKGGGWREMELGRVVMLGFTSSCSAVLGREGVERERASVEGVKEHGNSERQKK